jgi:hypothetical protein
MSVANLFTQRDPGDVTGILRAVGAAKEEFRVMRGTKPDRERGVVQFPLRDQILDYRSRVEPRCRREAQSKLALNKKIEFLIRPGYSPECLISSLSCSLSALGLEKEALHTVRPAIITSSEYCFP